MLNILYTLYLFYNYIRLLKFKKNVLTRKKGKKNASEYMHAKGLASRY
jgi:hypothetical protein